MTGSDIGSYAAGETIKIIGTVVLIACIPMAIAVGVGFIAGKKSVVPVVQTETELQKMAYTNGYRDGCLAVANIDRAAEGLPDYKDWKEFDKDLEDQHKINQGAIKVLKEELNRRAEKEIRATAFPRPWVKK